MRKYKGLDNQGRETASPQELLRDLRIRAGHYSRQANGVAKKNMLINKILTMVSCAIAISVAFVMSFHLARNVFGGENTDIHFAIVGCLVVAAISFLQAFGFDSRTSAKNLQISQEFYEIKEAVKLLQTAREVESIESTELLRRYHTLHERYQIAREKFIEHINSNRRYYGFARRPGSVRDVDDIPMKAIDDN